MTGTPAMIDQTFYQAYPAMDDRQFRQWQSLLEARTGIYLPPERQAFLQSKLASRMRELGEYNYQAYFDHVTRGDRGWQEWATLVDRLTVRETRFFRDPDAFAFIQQAFSDHSERHLEAWSLGCASGEEAYSLAITLAQLCRQNPSLTHFGVTGTDISSAALSQAREGLYPGSRLSHVAPELLSEHFLPQADGRFQVSAALRERVCFSRLNVLELEDAPMHGMDLVFCQNLLIYFRRWRRRQIVNMLVERLQPGGLLILGQGDLTDWQHPLMERLPEQRVAAWRRRSPESVTGGVNGQPA